MTNNIIFGWASCIISGTDLNINGAWKKSERFYKNVLDINHKSTDARMSLSALYANSWNPGDTSTYENYYKGFSLLKDIYRDGDDTLNSTLYHNLLLYSIGLRSKSTCYDAMFKFMKYFPSDTNIAMFKSAISSFRDKCMKMERNNTTIIYENRCAKFRVKYPDDFLLFKEDPNQEGKGIGVLMIETPMTTRDQYEAIRNSIAIIATPSKLTSNEELIQKFFSRGRLTQDSIRSMPNKNNTSLYYSSHLRIPDEYKGVMTIIKNGNYIYQIMYTATVATFDKNLKFYLSFERSLSFL